MPLADTVSAAHSKGITHRDLKLANVIVNEFRRPEHDFLLPHFCLEERDPIAIQVHYFHIWAPVRDDPRWQPLASRIGLPEAP